MMLSFHTEGITVAEFKDWCLKILKPEDSGSSLALSCIFRQPFTFSLLQFPYQLKCGGYKA
jgi:hypothetical protein